MVPSAFDAPPMASNRTRPSSDCSSARPFDLSARRVKWNHAERDAPLSDQRFPRSPVGVMVEVGDDDDVTLVEPASQSPGQVEGQRRHVLAEHHLLGRQNRKSAIASRAAAISVSVSSLVG
jgi:hypothetical protein